MRGFATLKRSEAAFTLIEVLVVVLVIGVLAAIALPVFFGQKDKGDDAAAKSDARNLAGGVIACEKGDYTQCDSQGELGSEADGYAWGSGPGEVRVLPASSDEFAVEATSRAHTGAANNRFTLSRAANGVVTRTCTGSDGCNSGSW